MQVRAGRVFYLSRRGSFFFLVAGKILSRSLQTFPFGCGAGFVLPHLTCSCHPPPRYLFFKDSGGTGLAVLPLENLFIHFWVDFFTFLCFFFSWSDSNKLPLGPPPCPFRNKIFRSCWSFPYALPPSAFHERIVMPFQLLLRWCGSIWHQKLVHFLLFCNVTLHLPFGRFKNRPQCP